MGWKLTKWIPKKPGTSNRPAAGLASNEAPSPGGKSAAGWEFGSACEVGRKRRDQPNQDALDIVLAPQHPPLLLVADGLGGHRGGTTASQLVIQVFRQQFLQTPPPEDYLSLLHTCARKAHMAVRVRGAQDAKLGDMGSTIVAAVLGEGQVYLLNVGDSRAYVLRGEKIIQISQDQSWVGEQVRAGLLTPQQALRHPKRNRLSMAITAKRTEIKPYSREFRLKRDDILVLCSDGLWGAIPETLIWAAVNELPPQQAADKLAALANQSGGPDNISVVVARRFEPQRKPAPVNLEDTNPGR